MRLLHTARLILSPLDAQDSNELFTIRGDPESMKFWDAPADDGSAATAEIVSLLLRDVQAGRATYWTARKRLDDRFVGLFDLSDIQSRSADLGFMIVRDFWGAGLAFEACEAVIREARQLGLTRLRARRSQ